MENKKVSFWWDFDKDMVIIESDDLEYPLVAIWKLSNKKDATKEIELAEDTIKRLEEGNLDYRVLASVFDDKFVKTVYPNFKRKTKK